jgi:hypothetical protein
MHTVDTIRWVPKVRLRSYELKYLTNFLMLGITRLAVAALAAASEHVSDGQPWKFSDDIVYLEMCKARAFCQLRL